MKLCKRDFTERSYPEIYEVSSQRLLLTYTAPARAERFGSPGADWE